MRVDWVHPSWRDLVIEQLAADDALRTRFLASCELPGALLALSAGGGTAGERVLPLLKTDADWDALTGRLRLIVREDGPAAVLPALEEAIDALAFDVQRLGEARAMVQSVCSVVLAAWQASPAGVDAAALASWFALDPGVGAPPCAAAVMARAPGFELDLTRGEDVTQLEDWVALAEVVREVAPGELERIEYPAAFLGDVALAFARAGDRHGRVDPRVARIGQRFNRQGFDLDFAASHDGPDLEEYLPPNEGPLTSSVPRSLVERVLRDL